MTAIYCFPLACKVFCIHFHNYVLYCMFELATQFLLGILNANAAAAAATDDDDNNNSETYKKNYEGYGNSARFM